MSNSHSKPRLGPSSEVERILGRDAERRKRQEQIACAEQEARLPLQELWNAVFEFSKWRSFGGTSEERAKQFVMLAEQLRSVIERHHFENFYDLIGESQWSGDYSEVHTDACALLLHLLKLPRNDAFSKVLQVVNADESVAQRATTFLVGQLHEEWYRDFANIWRLPENFTLYDLPFKMTPEGHALLLRSHPVVAKVEANFELYPDGVKTEDSRLIEFGDIIIQLARLRDINDDPFKNAELDGLEERLRGLRLLYGSPESAKPENAGSAEERKPPVRVAIAGVEPEGGKPTNSIPDWVNQHFSQKQFTLLKSLFAAQEVAESELCKLLDYLDPSTKFETLKRRVTQTNKNLCERSIKIGANWTIRERTREGIKSYFLERQN